MMLLTRVLTKLLACGAAVMVLTTSATAAIINIEFVLDESRSVLSSDFYYERQAIVSLLRDRSVFSGNDKVSVGVVYTGTTARTVVPLTEINDVSRGEIARTLGASYQNGGSTCLRCGISQAVSDFGSSGATSRFQFINVIAQGQNTRGSLVASREAALNAGVNQISCIDIGKENACTGIVGGEGSSGTISTDAGLNSTLRSVVASQIAFAAASAIPEPGTWAMMIVGMGLIGIAMRHRTAVGGVVRRRRQVTARV